MRLSTIDVTAERPYQVVVGTGALEFLPQYLADVQRIAVIHGEFRWLAANAKFYNFRCPLCFVAFNAVWNGFEKIHAPKRRQR